MATAVRTQLGFGRQSRNFVRHFFEMCISMCVGGFLLYYLVFTAIPEAGGWGDLRARFPEAALLLIALLLAAPMSAWMLVRGMPWRPTVEMAVVPLVLAIIVIVLSRSGVLPTSWLQMRWGELCGLSCIGMFAVMLLRLGLYTGRSGQHARHSVVAS